MTNDLGRVPLAPGSREPDQQAVPALTGFDPSRCTECNGEGYVEKSPNKDYADGSYRPTQWKDCPICGGRGWLGC